MAEGLTSLIGDALVALLESVKPRIASQVNAWVGSVSDVVRPNPPMSVRTTDGEILTGLLVCDGGDVIFFIGTRAPARGAQPHRPDPPRAPQDPYRTPGGAIPMWPSDFDGVDPRDLGFDRHRP